MLRPYIDEAKVEDLSEYKKLIEEEDYPDFDEFGERARRYIDSFPWCDGVTDVKVGLFFFRHSRRLSRGHPTLRRVMVQKVTDLN